MQIRAPKMALAVAERTVGHKERLGLLLWLVGAALLVLIAVAFFPPRFKFGAGVYLPMHTAMEVFTIIVAWLVFAVSWNSNDRERAGTAALFGSAFLGVALIDLIHTLSFGGMPDLVTPSTPEKAINFSLASRALAALALLGIAFLPWRPLRPRGAKSAYLLATAALVAFVCWIGLYRADWLPRTFVPGTGLTAFKIVAEYVIVALHIAGGVGFFRLMRAERTDTWPYLLAASAILVASQIFNTFYVDPQDIYNLLSHVYRVVAYILLYRGIFLSSIREPYELANRLRGELEVSAARLRDMSARLREEVEAERKRIARSLHDEMGQDLTALRMDLDWMHQHYPDHVGLAEVSKRMRTTIESSAGAMRRIISDLRPLMLDDLGITAAMNSLVKEVGSRAALDVRCTTQGEFDDLPDSHQTALYRIVQESLTNVVRHASAHHVDVSLKRQGEYVVLIVRDDGIGLPTNAPSKKNSFGMFGMQERALELDGDVQFESAVGGGTTVTVRLKALPEPQSIQT